MKTNNANKIWLITGAARGIGREIALAALRSGDRVVATGRKVQDIQASLADAGAGDRLLALSLDITDEVQAKDAVTEAAGCFGRIDVLVNNAGYGQLGMFETVEAEAIAKQYQTNVFGTFNVIRAVLPTMRKQRSGHILNLSSIGGVVGFGGATAYTSSKFAIEGFSEDLAIEVKPFGIHVTIVEPGFFRTDFLEGSSVKYGAIEIADYAEAVARQRARYDAHNHKQPGDPAKLGPAIVKIAQADHPPLRYAAGSDAVRMTQEALEKRLAELAQWKELSVSTDSDDAEATSNEEAKS